MLPGTAVCVADPVPVPVPVPVPLPAGEEEAALPGVPLTVVLGINGTPFIAACTAMPSPTLIQSSCAQTHDVSQRVVRKGGDRARKKRKKVKKKKERKSNLNDPPE